MPPDEPLSATLSNAQRQVDPAALARVQQRVLAQHGAPWLHTEVARRMAERLPVIRLQPACVLDWCAQLGGSRALLQRAYPRAQVVAVELAAVQRDATAQALKSPWWSPRRWQGAPDVLLAEQVTVGQGQLLWANMVLHGSSDPLATMRRWHQATAVDGFVMFSTLGPGSLEGLRALYARHGWPPPHAPFVDMHDLGDMLVEAGFADPVMDQETLTLHWADGAALLAELRGLGGNVHPHRPTGLRTPRWQHALQHALQELAGADGRPALGFEIVYGHAFRPAPRARVAAVTTVAAEDLRTMARAGRRGGSVS
jgi:malonyl-CoA O-methyltransferase